MFHTGKRGPFLIPLLLLLFVAPSLARAVVPVEAHISAEAFSIKPGEVFTVDLLLDVRPGWHVYGPLTTGGSTGTGLPTTVVWELPQGFSALPLEWPKAERFSFGSIDSEGYSGKLLLRARILAPNTIEIGESVSMKVRVEWLACRVECMPGGASLKLSLPVAAAAGPIAPGPRGMGLALALVLAFAGGLILNLMPCVLPVLSLKALSLAKRSSGHQLARDHPLARERPFATGLYFTAGVLVSFWLFAGILLAIRAGGRAYGWGFQLQNPAFVVAAATVFFLVGLNLFGVFEVGVSLTRLGSIQPDPKAGGRGAALSSFLSGLFATAVATPCTAPFMGAAVGYALSHNAAVALGVFTALGLGMAAPMLALSAVPGLARLLPKPGAWMVTFRQVLGFPMMAAVVWMAFVLAGLSGASAMVSLLEGLLAAGMGAWAWGTWGRFDRPVRGRIAAAVLALALVVGGAYWSIRSAGASGQGRSGTEPRSASIGAAAKAPVDAFWRPWSEDALAGLRRRGVPVFVDFTADWCLSCQVNEAVALDDGAMRVRFAELGIVALKADWTRQDEAIGRALAELGRASVPLYALYVPGAEAPIILPEILTPVIALRYLNENVAPKR
ncbi:MAG: thioredoxin family protein [Rectinemataceae bacterium]